MSASWKKTLVAILLSLLFVIRLTFLSSDLLCLFLVYHHVSEVVVKFSLECHDVIVVTFLHYAFGLTCSRDLELKSKLSLLKVKRKPIAIAQACFLALRIKYIFLPRVLLIGLLD